MELMRLKNRKRRAVYEVTGKQIAATMLVATFALTFVFFVGVYIGKNRAIDTNINEQNSATSNIVSSAKQTTESQVQQNPVPTDQTDNAQKAPNDTETPPPKIFTKLVKSEKNVEQQSNAVNDANQNIKPDQKTPQDVAKNQGKDEPKKTEIIDDKLKWTVKVGTFATYGNAKRLFDSLKASGYDPRLKSESDQQGTVYHVTVGEFDNVDKAKEYGNSMRGKLEYVNDYVVREIK
jgi:cell division septation protein DedD